MPTSTRYHPLLKAGQDRQWHVYLLAVGFPPLWHAWKVLSSTFSHAGAGNLAAQGEFFLHWDGLCCWEPPSTGPAREEHLLSRCRGGFPKLLSWASASTGVVLAPRPREGSCLSCRAVRCCGGTRQPRQEQLALELPRWWLKGWDGTQGNAPSTALPQSKTSH